MCLGGMYWYSSSVQSPRDRPNSSRGGHTRRCRFRVSFTQSGCLINVGWAGLASQIGYLRLLGSCHSAAHMSFVLMWTSYLNLVRTAINPRAHGRGLHFSYTKHITLCSEREADLGETAIGKHWWDAEEKQFFWNRFLSDPIIGRRHLKSPAQEYR